MTYPELAPEAPIAAPTALLVAAFDSQLKWCARIRDELVARGFRCQAVVPDSRSALSETQIADAGFAQVARLSWADLMAAVVASDVVVCGLSGPLTKTVLIDLAERLGGTSVAGPVVVTGWVGVIIEKITAGYLDRSGSDVIAVNSTRDLEHFRHTARLLSLPEDNLLLAGLPFLSGKPTPPRPSCRRVLFADQPTVPSSPAERLFIYQRLIDYALAHPDRDVVLKPRHRIGEDTYHRMRHHPETLLAGTAYPANFSIDYTPISEQLPTVDLLITVSSTACLEALDHGSRVALVLDLGVHERYGNHVFLDSGLLRTWQQMIADDLGEPEPGWLDSFFFAGPATHRGSGHSTATIVDRVEKLLATGERPSRAVWAAEYFQSIARVQQTLRGARTVATPASRARLIRGTASRAARELLPPVISRRLRAVARRARG
ncbi:MAG TPA: DUF6716 putative glycosyltransferase [Propionibacteriaceae bacterium]|nr:DUF6716 putative glycosyltransferase [Propionibacteriaceae bacterium]